MVPAGVVTIEAVAALGARTEVGATARAASQHPGQQVVRRVRRPVLDLGGSLVQQCLGPTEEVVVDDRGVLAVVDRVAVGGLPHVHRVAQHPEDGLVAPEPFTAVAQAGTVEAVREAGRAEVLVRVDSEDLPYGRRFRGIGDEGLGGRVDAATEGSRTAATKTSSNLVTLQLHIWV